MVLRRIDQPKPSLRRPLGAVIAIRTAAPAGDRETIRERVDATMRAVVETMGVTHPDVRVLPAAAGAPELEIEIDGVPRLVGRVPRTWTDWWRRHPVAVAASAATPSRPRSRVRRSSRNTRRVHHASG